MDLRSVALTLGDRWPVFPLMPGAKKPATRSGVDSATRDPDRISAWWERIPSCNVGVRCGDGLLVVDLDPTETTTGYVSLSSYAASVSADPGWLETFTVHTPRAMHLYYRTTAHLGNRVDVLPGVDARSERGYVVAPYSRVGEKQYLPESGYRESVSIDAAGTEYLEEFAPELIEAPDWLVDLIARPKPAADRRAVPEVEIRHGSAYLEAVLLGERHRLMLAKPGERNHVVNVAAYRLGKHVAAGRLDYDQAESWLIATAGQVLEEDSEDRGPLTEQEIAATVRSGLDAGVRHG